MERNSWPLWFLDLVSVSHHHLSADIRKDITGFMTSWAHVSTVIPVIEIDLRFAPGFNGNVSGIVSRQEGQ